MNRSDPTCRRRINLLTLVQMRTIEPAPTETNLGPVHRESDLGQGSYSQTPSILDEYAPFTRPTTGGAGTGPDPRNSDTLQRPSAEAALLLGRHSFQTRGGLGYLAHKSTSPTLNPPAGPPSNAVRNIATAALRHHRSGLVYLPNTEPISATSTINLTPDGAAGSSSGITQGMTVRYRDETVYPPPPNISSMSMFGPAINPTTSIPYLGYHAPAERVPTIPMIGPTFDSLLTGTTQMDLGIFTHGGSRFTPQHSIPEPPSGPSTLSQQWEVTDEQDSRTSHMDVDHEIHGRESHFSRPDLYHANTERVSTTSAAIPHVSAPATEPAPGQSSQLHTPETLPSPPTPTPVGSGRRRGRSRQSNAIDQEIPQMLGEMRTVIGDLATSVNGLKDAVSDLRSGQNTLGGFGAASVRNSGKGKGRARTGGGNNNSGGTQSSSGGGSQSRGAGDEYVADDEGQGDEVERPKNYQLRVSYFVHACLF